MFQQTKPYEQFIEANQPRIRLGNRVPTDAVNLAYAYLPTLTPSENVQVTDLSNSIFENSKNAQAADMLVIPDDSLLLRTEDNQQQFPTSDIMMTNMFHKDVPLYHSHVLRYHFYNNKGTDDYGIYQGDGISIIDHAGRPVGRPYKIQLIADEGLPNLYRVIIYTSFKDAESDTYSVVYDAVQTQDTGFTATSVGYKERLNLTQAFTRLDSLKEIIDMKNDRQASPKFFRANGSSPGHSKYYVPSSSVKDIRHREHFRYQITLEITTSKETTILTSPWYSSDILHSRDLMESDQDEYASGSKLVTTETAYQIMSGLTDLSPYASRNIIKKYYVRSNNDKVQLFTRMDGTSNVLGTLATLVENDMILPIKSKLEVVPGTSKGKIKYQVRNIKALATDKLYLTFLIDGSGSMQDNDPAKATRIRLLKNILAGASSYYDSVNMNGYIFRASTTTFNESFTTNVNTFITRYEGSGIDNDISDISNGIDLGIIPLSKLTGPTIKKHTIIITDGQFDGTEEAEFVKSVKNAKSKGITVGVITFNNLSSITALLQAEKVPVISAVANQLNQSLRYYFFERGDAVSGTLKELEFEITPTINGRSIHTFSSNTLLLPDDIKKDPERYGVEVTLEADSCVTAYLEESGQQQLTTNGTMMIPLKDIVKDKKSFSLKGWSNCYERRFVPVYSIRYNDKQQIKVLAPNETHRDQSWFLRVKNGRFTRMTLNDKDERIYYMYGIPEYYRQPFDKKKGQPYISIQGEKPKVLDETQIRVANTPLYSEFDLSTPTNLTVFVNGKKTPIKTAHMFNGIIELESSITTNDEIRVDYQYEESSYIYRGYFDETDGSYYALDLNPSAGHYISVRDNDAAEVLNMEGFALLSRTIYLYMKPMIIMKDTGSGDMLNIGTPNKSTLFHSFEKLEDETLILIGEIRVRPNSNIDSINVIDTRVRGGGLKPEITQEIMREFEEESLQYWDIGYWDGKPFSENAVVNIRISRAVLKEYGGQFSKSEVEEKVSKHLGYGIFPIIEFIVTSDYLLEIPRNLHADVIDIADSESVTVERPTFELSEVKL